MTSSNPASLPPSELCGGQQVGNLSVASQCTVGIHPTGLQLWGKPLSRLSAVTCPTCGHTRMFATDPDKIRTEAGEHPEAFHW